ncbi:hypothetical protein MKX01_009025 [Papaver californicum]|nr:hypothetical protein MKX01_009025 [Papaver californicum]
MVRFTSLSRARKVREQPPKVIKQVKKKSRGRVHKRMQYNRRFFAADFELYSFGEKLLQ